MSDRTETRTPRPSRRGAMSMAAGVALGVGSTARAQTPPATYGLIGSLTATSGQRDALAAVLPGGPDGMAGCLGYVVALDAKDPDRIWITELWTSKAAHDASLGLPAVQAAITRGRPLIAGFGPQVETRPVAGVTG